MYEIYEIQNGDTLDIIAEKTGTTIDKLQEINKFISIVPGANIIVPSLNNDIFTIYTVKSGDNAYAISRKYNIDVDDLYSLNGLNKNEYLYPNQKLLVPNQNVDIYITKKGDTIDKVTKAFNGNYNKFFEENSGIYLMPDQLVVIERNGI